MAEHIEIVKWLVGQSVAVGVLAWFMFRNERLVKSQIEAVAELRKSTDRNSKLILISLYKDIRSDSETAAAITRLTEKE